MDLEAQKNAQIGVHTGSNDTEGKDATTFTPRAPIHDHNNREYDDRIKPRNSTR